MVAKAQVPSRSETRASRTGSVRRGRPWQSSEGRVFRVGETGGSTKLGKLFDIGAPVLLGTTALVVATLWVPGAAVPVAIGNVSCKVTVPGRFSPQLLSGTIGVTAEK